MAPYSSTLAWKIPWMEEPGGPQSMGLLRVGHDWATSLSLFSFMHWRRKWQPTPAFLPGESQGWGSLVGCRPLGRTESDTTEATQQQNIVSHVCWPFVFLWWIVYMSDPCIYWFFSYRFVDHFVLQVSCHFTTIFPSYICGIWAIILIFNFHLIKFINLLYACRCHSSKILSWASLPV